MVENHTTSQPGLFDHAGKAAEVESVFLCALGEFQARGKLLAGRELPLDRLRGAFKRAAEKYSLPEFSDDEIAANLERMGAKIVKVPSFVAKHPFRVTISGELAEKAESFFLTIKNDGPKT